MRSQDANGNANANRGAKRPPRLRRLIGFVGAGAVILGLSLWSVLAIAYSNLPPAWARAGLAAVFAAVTLGAFLSLRPLRAWTVFLACFGAVVTWFWFTPPSNSRDWQPDVALLPWAEIGTQQVTLHNIRNCEYRSETDYTVHSYDESLDLGSLRSADLYVVHWGSPLIAHTMLSFNFDSGVTICFSIEARKEKSEAYSAIKGFFRQFELIYVMADERDLVRLRTNFRREEVHLYHLTTDPSVVRLVFLDYLHEINQLRGRPEWYNAATSNCTTNIRGHTKAYAKDARFDWRILINGSVDQLAYERGALDRTLPFSELRKRSLINARARAADSDPAFSTRIREGLPGFSENPIQKTTNAQKPI